MFKETNNITQSENVNNIVYDGIGFNGIRYIQESGQKEKGKIYLDKNQPGLWYCLNTNSSINNTSDFTRADSTALLDKLQNLVSVSIDNLEVRAPQLFSQKLIPIGTKRIIIYAKNGSGSSAYHTPGTCIEYPFKHSGQSLAFIGMHSSVAEADGYIATFRETNGYLDLVRIEGETSNSNNNFICKIEFQLI